MSTDELHAIHQRLDRLEEKLDSILTVVAEQMAVCGPTRQRLDVRFETGYGNGRDGLLTRVDRLETVRRLGAQLAAAVLGLLSGIALTVLAWILER